MSKIIQRIKERTSTNSLLIASVIIFAVSSASNAAILYYHYEGPPLTVPNGCEPFCPPGVEETVYGGFVIDEALVPVGTVRGTNFSVRHGSYGIRNDDGFTWKVIGKTKSFTGALDQSILNNPDWSVIGVVSWSYPFFHSYINLESSFSFSFDDDRNLVEWFGSAMEGGSNDMTSSTQYDTMDVGLRSEGPGVWTKTVLVEDPALVPLGGSLGMALIGLIGIGFANRRKAIKSCETPSII